MGVDSVKQFHSVVFASPSATFTQLTRARIGPNIRHITERSAGEPWPQGKAVERAEPDFMFDTHELLSATAICGLNGVNTSGGNVTFHTKTVTKFGARGTTGGRWQAAETMTYIQRIRCNHEGHATVSMVVCCIYDGTNVPVVYNASAAIAGDIATPQLYGLGFSTINGTELKGLKNIDIDFGYEVIKESSGGETFPTFVGLRQGDAVIRLETLQEGAWADTGLCGAPITSYAHQFRLRENYGCYVDGVDDVTVSGTSGLILPLHTEGGGTDNAMTGLELHFTRPDKDTLPLLLGVTS